MNLLFRKPQDTQSCALPALVPARQGANSHARMIERGRVRRLSERRTRLTSNESLIFGNRTRCSGPSLVTSRLFGSA